jgi:hypothetical protein
LSEQLSDPDIFWIAEQYLNVPHEIYPDRLCADKWYSDIRTRWENDEPLLTPAEFFAVKSAARHALSEVEIDVGFWLDILGAFEARSHDHRLRREASYEIAVLQLRSGRALQGHEHRLHQYFQAVPQLTDPEELEDAANLLQYAWGARNLGQAGIPHVEIASWWAALRARVEELLKTASTAGRKAILLENLGRSALFRLGEDGATSFDVDALMPP